MDQEVIVAAIGEHLDAIETYVNTIAVLAIAAAWAGVRRSREVEAFGTKFDRRHAFWALAALYLLGNMAILVLFLRVGDLVLALDHTYLVSGLSELGTHSWILNPFSYFGDAAIARLHSSEGYGLLIATWWLCNTSLSMLMDDKGNRGAHLLFALFLAVGLGSMFAIQRVYGVVLVATRLGAPDLHAAISNTVPERLVGNGLGIAVGGLIFVAANRLQGRLGTRRAEGAG